MSVPPLSSVYLSVGAAPPLPRFGVEVSVLQVIFKSLYRLHAQDLPPLTVYLHFLCSQEENPTVANSPSSRFVHEELTDDLFLYVTPGEVVGGGWNWREVN